MISAWRVAIVLLSLAGMANADAVAERPASERPVPGEDEALYACKNRTGKVAITLKPETELKDLIAWVMGYTCKNFILDPRIVSIGNKKVTVIAPNQMTATEAYRLFLVALSTINLTVVPKGNVLRIVDAPMAKKDSVPIYKNGVPDPTDQIVRYVYKPSYAQVETLQQAFTALRSDAGDVQLIGSILLITDYGSHVRDMMSLAHLIDVASGSDGIYTLTIQHADAAKLADEIGSILGLGAKPGAPVPPTAMAVGAAVPSKILVDERTNTMIIAASESGYNRVKALVERLDISLDIEGGSAIHVYRLGSAIAEELAKTLNEATTTPAKDPKATKPSVPGVPPIVDALGTAIQGQVRVIADPPTNALIVMSSGRDFLAIKDVIKQLDLPRRQVYIEAMILEVQIGTGLDIGTSSHAGVAVDDDSSLLIGGVQMPTLKSTNVSTLASATGLVGGLVGSSIGGSAGELLGKSIPSYAVLFQALASQSNTNVLSAPSIIALDNAQATYKVGTNIPFKRSQTVGGTGNLEGSVTSSIDRIDLQLELVIKPHVSIDDSVLLEIKHDAKDLAKESAELGPSWTTRSFDTRVLVRDQQTVVIGGLMQEREVETSDKVPFLGDIPVIGNLFKSTSKKKTKSNLVIMLTPYIVKDQMDLESIRARKVREHDEFAQSFKTLDAMPYRPATDYRRKRGLVEEINRALQAVEDDVAARASLARPVTVPQGVIEYPKHD